MNPYKFNFSATVIYTFLLIISIQSLLNGQDRYTQIQIGSQMMQNYNLGELIFLENYFYKYEEKSQRVATTFNHDISVTRTFDQHHGVTVGGGIYTTGRYVGLKLSSDNYLFLTDNFESFFKNFTLYCMYQYTTQLSTRLSGHLSAGPMWARNYNEEDWFYLPVKLNYFSALAKLGVQYNVADHFSIALHGVVVRSMTNIVDPKYNRTEGALIPFSVGADLRVGYKF
jgi:hypothetical protein